MHHHVATSMLTFYAILVLGEISEGFEESEELQSDVVVKQDKDFKELPAPQKGRKTTCMLD